MDDQSEIGTMDPNLGTPSQVLVGIDPGLSGAISILRPLEHAPGRTWVEAHDMPVLVSPSGKNRVNPSALAEILRPLDPERTVVFLELVNAMPRGGQTGQGMGAASAFNFGKSAGVLEGVVATLGFRWYEITPQVWKREAGLLKQPKDLARSVAQRLWPNLSLRKKKDCAVAEAALIAHFGARLKGEV